MSNDLYGKTTESIESLDSATCTTKLKQWSTAQSPTIHNRRSVGKTKAPSVSDMELQKVQHVPTGSQDDQYSVGIQENIDPYASNSNIQFNRPKPRFSRGKSITQSIAYNTLDFLGLTEDSENKDVTRKQKWDQRRVRIMSRYGRIKDSVSTASTPDVVDGPNRFADVVKQVIMRQQSSMSTRSVKRTNAAALLWKTAARKLSNKPNYEVSTIQSFGGRSFLPADLLDDDISVFGSEIDDRRSITPTPLPTPSLIDDRSFFHFDTIYQHPSTIEEEDSFDLTDGGTARSDGFQAKDRDILAPHVGLGDDFSSRSPSPNLVSTWDKRLGPEPKITDAAPGHRPDFLRQQSERRSRLSIKPDMTRIPLKKGKRQFGKGLVGSLLNRTFRRRIDSNVVKQMDDIDDHRPYFTYWVSFVQVVILIVMVSVYPFAPIGFSQKQLTKKILVSRNGVLNQENVGRKVVESFWIGPSLSSFTTFTPVTVCGQDPNDIHPVDKRPTLKVCLKTVNISSLDKEKFQHMHCKITGRPCCIGTQAQCIIASQQYCEFHEGVYHPDKTLCSQVDCFTSICGLLPFVNKDQPDQFYRLWLSLFLNAGVVHVVVILIFNFTILRDIEKMAGWLRTSIIFILSGIGGNLWSSILIPYEPEVGASGAAFGIIACLFVEVINAWNIIQNPFVALGKLCLIVLILFLLGLLPYIDNFAHIFGFIYGFVLSLIFLPYVSFGEWDETRKKIQIIVGVIIFVIVTIIGFVLFYEVQTISSIGITYFNCVPITENFCKNFHQGVFLEDRLTNYY